MELKQQTAEQVSAAITGFNRTFMELKHVQKKLAECKTMGFNRTFMELKLKCGEWNNPSECGLIVPL